MTRQPPKRMLRAVLRAAELRAQGFAWAEVARFVKAKLDTVRRWPEQFPEFWAENLATARAELDEEIAAEAKSLLRRRLRAKDDDGAVREALKLVVQLITRSRPDDRPKADPIPEFRQIADHLEGLSDAELRRYLLAHLDGDEEGDSNRDGPAEAGGVP
jgi:hypothetical protein